MYYIGSLRGWGWGGGGGGGEILTQLGYLFYT